MDFFYCWPYEELTVTKLEETRAFRFALPWYASVVETSAEGAELFSKLFDSDSAGFPQEEILEAYRLALSPTVHEPYAYILPMEYGNGSASPQALPSLEKFSSPMVFARNFDLQIFPQKSDWTWDVEAVLQMSRVAGTEFHSPLSLYSIFRRFFYLEAHEQDRTKRLYNELPKLCRDAEHLINALAYIIAQNLHVTQRCEAALSAARTRAGNNLQKLNDFAFAERGHDKIMEKALDAFPALAPWATTTNPATALLMDLFELTAKNNFMAFAFAICLFERPQLEETHPVTQMLLENGLHEAGRRYEVHHKINEAGEHDHIGFEMIQRMPLLTSEEALQATHWSEAVSWAMTSHSAKLLEAIASVNAVEG